MAPSFDFAMGVDAPSMDAAAAVVYRELYPKLFCGNRRVSKDGFDLEVSWDVKAAPAFVLAAPTGGEQIICEHLSQPMAERHFRVNRDDALRALAATLADQTLEVRLPRVDLTIRGDGSPATASVCVAIYVQVSSAGGVLSLDPLKAVATDSNPSDQWFINNVLLPEAMSLARTLLSSIQLPALSHPGLAMTAPAVFIDSGRIVALANLSGKQVPAPQPGTWPEASFFALMSNDAMLHIAQANAVSVSGKGGGKNGDIDIGIGRLYFDAEFAVASIQFSHAAADRLTFRGVIVGQASAGIKIGCTRFGLNYRIYAAPEPRGTITLSGKGGTEVVAHTSQLSTFALALEPSGNPVEWILSAATDPLLQTLAVAFSPAITTLFEGLSFDAFAIPAFAFDYDRVHLSAQLRQIQIADFQGVTAITGTLDFGGA